MAAPPTIPINGGLKSICEAIWRIETDLDLFQRQVAGVYVWRLIRWEVSRAFAQRAGLAVGSPGSGPRPVSYRIRHELAALRQSLAHSAWSSAGSVETILVPFPRKHQRGGVKIDIHTEALLAEPAFRPILALERTEAQHHVQARPDVFIADRDRGRPEAVGRALLTFPAFLVPLKLLRTELEAAARREFGMDFPISLNSLALRVALFREHRAVSRRMLRATGAKRLVAAWHDQVMFAAAADLGMATVEIQHAAFSRYNLHYHFPYRGEIPYFASRFLAFGRYWIDHVELPANTRATVVGSSNIAALREVPVDRQPRRLVVTSQGPTYWPLLECTVETARITPDWEFIFRPHPREDVASYRDRIANLGGAPPNLRLSDHAEDVYQLIKSADVQMGVASTTLFEGMSLGCRTIVFKAPGCEAMEEVLRVGDAVLAATPAEVFACLASAPTPHDLQRYYANPSNLSAALGGR